VLLDRGMSCAAIATVLLLDHDTTHTCYRLYEEYGIEGLPASVMAARAVLGAQQQDALKAWITEWLQRTMPEVGAWMGKECGIEYQSWSGLIALLHCLGMEHRKLSSG
jgi:transposase